MADPDARKLVTLRLDGADEHQGHVMAHALKEKLDQFLKTFGSFERTYLQERTRQTDFEVVTLSHNSPTMMGFKPVARTRKYLPTPTVIWTLDQWDKIARGQRPDDIVDEDLVADVADLAQRADPLAYAKFFVSYGQKAILFDETAHNNALKLRLDMHAKTPALPWRQGTTRGTVAGTLESVINAEQERQIVICPFFGPHQITCQFTDDLKDQIRAALFNVVKITGLMHYSVASPHPVLIEVQSIERVAVQDDAPRFLDAGGLFKEGVYPSWASGDLYA